MSSFDNISVVKKANIYFDGLVSSRTIRFEDGTEKTLGLMLPGEYRFNAEVQETMEILSGELEVQIAGDSQWKTFRAGQAFVVPAGSFFVARVKEPTDYCCSYLR